jgi:hypothetical protein
MSLRISIALLFLFFSAGSLWAEDAKSSQELLEIEDNFIYDSQGKKNPFLPGEPVWTATRTATRLRESFLDGVLWDSNKALAVLDGVILRQGDEYLGGRVARIEKDRAVFLVDEEEITVMLAPPREEDTQVER